MWRHVVGWSAAILSTAITCFWAFWGIIENFHEGWYFESNWANLGLMFAQYLTFMFAFLTIGVVSILWPRVGAILHLAVGIFAAWFFGIDGAAGQLIVAPAVIMSLAYWFGIIRPRKRAVLLLCGATLLTLFICGAEPTWRILIVGRTNDGDFGARTVHGNGVTLIWAPEGPGWPKEGIEWDEAVRRCRHLSEDGLSLRNQPQDVWRLPTAEEAIKSMHRHGKPCNGRWDGKSAFPQYDVQPDKETPLWNVHSHVIYWWTATEIDADHAYMVCYNGQVRRRDKQHAPAYFAFRAVKDPPDSERPDSTD